MRHQNLLPGLKSKNGQVEIINADSLCYVVKNLSKGASGVRTISKSLLNEFIDYFEKYPENTSDQARKDLCGKSDIDRFEYGYYATLTTMAKMVLGTEPADDTNIPSKTEIEDSVLNQFIRNCFKLFYSIDHFDSFWQDTIPATGWNDALFRTIKDQENQIFFTGLFRADKKDGGNYFNNEFHLDGHIWYLQSNWYKVEFMPGTNSRNSLSLQCFERFVNRYYPRYAVEVSDNSYRLTTCDQPVCGSFQSSNAMEFWNHIAPVVLSADENFSKLPRYYHKGHVRVISNYGGATNFSIGFYDKDSGRVNRDVSFEFNDQPNAKEHLFYLFTDLKDTKAFERFIPVFNDTYQGVFHISYDGTSYYFKDLREQIVTPYRDDNPRQMIYFGAPGTGKSHAVNTIVNREAPNRNVRTIFHPDTDYSSFVGCFKPTMRDGKIEYAFTPQAFVNAYIKAWRDISKPFYLIIEEINRGNCAQIFGDIFQLLDRNADGESSYSISPDSDLKAYIADKLSLQTNIPDEIRNGSEMRLPSNLFIYATMNTSDQSLFPIDSAFKRRWDWHYTAIGPTDSDPAISIDNQSYSWSSFIELVNKKIFDLTRSEDKQLGYWFIKPDINNQIGWKPFVSKVIFYIWNDVVKDYAPMESQDSPFGKNYAFTTFFDKNGDPQANHVVEFLDALGVKKHSLMQSEVNTGNSPSQNQTNETAD